jgi:hypothetical protein
MSILKKFTFLLFVTMVSWSVFASNNQAQSNIKRYGKGWRLNKNGWIRIHIEGRPYQRGVQYGYLVAPELAQALKTAKYLDYHDFGKHWKFFKKSAMRLFLSKINEEYLTEMKGIAAGARKAGVKVGWKDILAWNASNEVTNYWWPNKSKEHCSAFIATGDVTQDKQIVMAHDNFNTLPLGEYDNVILDIKPTQGHRIIMQTKVGYIFSFTDFFETDAGLIGTETTIGDFNRFDRKGTPEFIRMRKATQYANNINQWINIMLKHNNGAYANDWFLGNIKTGEIVRFELGLKYHHIWKTKNGYFIGYNGAEDARVRNLECTSSESNFDIRTSVASRKVRLTQLMHKYYGKINPEIAEKIMADHYDVYLHKINPSSRTVDGHVDLDPEYYTPATIVHLPFQPERALDGKVTDTTLAKQLTFYARWGSPSGMPFNAHEYVTKHPQWDYLKDYLLDLPTQPWTKFKVAKYAKN